ncbi:MAG: LamG-like jellyroll fold domain-containing protein [Planctomycetota bacterium]
MADDNSKIEDDHTLAKKIAEKGVLGIKDVAKVTLQLVNAVSELHSQGKIHRKISADTIHIDEALTATLDSIEREVTLGGIGVDLIPSPPQLHNIPPLSLPAEIKAARQVLTEAGILLDPHQIDFYQLGALLCFMVSGHSVSDYLHSCKAKADVPEEIVSIIDRALGMNAKEQFESTEAFISEIEAVISGKPAAKDRSSLPDSIFIEPSSKTDADGQLPFKKLGHYEIIECIGHGGMGDVYKGYEKALDRFVAIKVLPVQLARQKDFVKRFHAEATAIAKIDHPNIVRIYYSGEDQGYQFFVMQYVDGESLADLLTRCKKLSVSEAMPIIEQCLAGIGAAHKRGLIHRDIKPGNVLLDRHSRRALVTDFGVVKSIHTVTQITVTGTIMGTADYIAPEQARGSEVDCRTDLYAMGVLMYQMLSGKLPFDAKSATSMMFQHAYEPPPPLSEVAPEVPEKLADVVMKLMAKDAKDRFQSTDDVLTVLQNIDLEGAKAASTSQTRIIEAPRFYSTPELPANLSKLTGKSLFGRLRNKIADFFGTHAPQVIDYMQTTTQQVDGAVAEYQRQRDKLAELAKEAKIAAEDFEVQAKANRKTAQAAGERAEVTKNTEAKQRALKEKQESEQAAAELAQFAAEQAEQAEEISLRLAKLDAKLVQLRSQRDALNARMNAAQARLKADQTRPSRWHLSKQLIHTAIILLLVCLATTLAYFLWLIVSKDSALIAYWKFDEGVGDIAYDSAGKNNGTIHGATWTNGINGGALSFDGKNNFVMIPDSDVFDFGKGDFSILAWFKATSAKDQFIVRFNGATKCVETYINSKSYVGSYIATNTKEIRLLYNNKKYNGDQWHHMAITMENGKENGYKLFIDGTMVGSLSCSEFFSDWSNLTIGANPEGSWNKHFFNGMIDEVQIYNRALSAKKIQKLYQSQVNIKPSAPSGLIAYWKFEEGNGNIAHDSAGNNNGQIYGATWTTGKIGRALSFDGKDSYVMIPDSDVFDFGMGDLSISLWFKTSNSKDQFMINFHTKRAICLEMYMDSAYCLGTYIDAGSDMIRLPFKGQKINDEKWHHAAITLINGTTNGYKLFLDGIMVGSLTCSARLSDWTQLVIGGNPISADWNKKFFNGLIDDVQIYNRALSAQEVQQLYRSTASIQETPENTGWVDILKLIDVERDTRAGQWRFENGVPLSIWEILPKYKASSQKVLT